ncbi:VCBS repeat-containing protein [Panacibacter sp. DH6]|uniref:VCBS repeat-containing protein n=1 Tax=Panacibacter microcysteis TaxID=2793269 RepID=A0A931E8D2_9BACT|nr:VCBS repeat-containing protein [Panacibacter microcysteis]MBG9377256.1 VCBS repeat-containing protein [Panacibacter microcysteis]
MKRNHVITLLLASVITVTCTSQPAITFKKHIISATFVSEGVATGDVNNDGNTDILAGNYWYEAPSFKPHMLHADTVNPVPSYSTTFLNYTLDVNNDGWIDLIRFDQPGAECAWYENPQHKQGLWQKHLILAGAGNENPAFADVDGDGRNDIICNDTLAKEVIWLRAPVAPRDTAWQRTAISRNKNLGTHRYTHGLGFGDLDQDGKKDVLLKSGWWQSPVNPLTPDWTFTAADFGDDCANMFVLDADKDGDMDVITSSTHNYGIWWHEQKRSDSKTVWETHLISKQFSQSHALAMEDINGDGNPDLITGKRYKAHNGGDPGTDEPAVLYWFEYIPGRQPRWLPHEIDNNSGIGNSFAVTDLNKDGLPDIIVSNKKGVYYFEQSGK